MSIVCACAAAEPAIAQLVYDNNAGGAAGIDDATLSDRDSGIYSSDDFTIPVTTTIVRIEWTGVYALDGTPPSLDDYQIRIQADSGSGPGAVLSTTLAGNAVNRIDSGIDLLGLDVFNYSADILPFTAAAGTNYWLVIFNNTSGDAGDDWFWGSRFLLGNSTVSNDFGATWSAAGHRIDFRLFSAIPEPSVSFVSMLMIAGLAFHRKKR